MLRGVNVPGLALDPLRFQVFLRTQRLRANHEDLLPLPTGSNDFQVLFCAQTGDINWLSLV